MVDGTVAESLGLMATPPTLGSVLAGVVDAAAAVGLDVRVLGGQTRLSERATEARSQAWRPWRAYAVLHLWHLSTPTPGATP